MIQSLKRLFFGKQLPSIGKILENYRKSVR